MSDDGAPEEAAGADPPFSELALVAANAVLGENVRIGPFSVIGRDGAEPVEIGRYTTIGEHVFIEPGARIGPNCIIEDHCRIGGGSEVAANSRIRSGVLRSGDVPARSAAPSPAEGSGPNTSISPHALVAANVEIGEGVEIGPFAIIGWDSEEPVAIGAGTRIAPFALVEPGATIGSDCEIDAYCRIGYCSSIGNETKILYGAAIFEQVRIGRACIVGGNVADRTVIEDFVTHFGEIAHAYRDPGDLAAWDTKQSRSPTIRTRSVIAQNAIIIGGLTIGPSSYVAAGEVLRVNVPEGMLYQRRDMIPIADTRGLVRTRRDGLDE